MRNFPTERPEWRGTGAWRNEFEPPRRLLDEIESIRLEEADYADLPQAGNCLWWGVALLCLGALAMGYLSVEVAAIMVGFCLLISKQRSELREIRLELRRLAP